MKHVFKQGRDASKPVLLLLHGTGGTAHNLLPLAERIDPDESVEMCLKMECRGFFVG